MLKKIIKKKGVCFGCKCESKKSDFKKRNGIFICQKCGYYNAESIFFDYQEIKPPQLIFGVDTQETIKKKKKKK